MSLSLTDAKAFLASYSVTYKATSLSTIQQARSLKTATTELKALIEAGGDPSAIAAKQSTIDSLKSDITTKKASLVSLRQTRAQALQTVETALSLPVYTAPVNTYVGAERSSGKTRNTRCPPGSGGAPPNTDTTPTSGSSNSVTSNGVYQALTTKQSTLNSLNDMTQFTGDPAVALLLHCEDSTDSGYYNCGFTGSFTTTTTCKFGTRALDIGNANTRTFTLNSASSIGTGDFTVDFWFYSTVNYWSQLWELDTVFFRRYQPNVSTTKFYINIDGVEYISSQVSGWNTYTWHHIALSRQSGTLRIFFNGTKYFEQTITASLTSSQMKLGCLYGQFASNPGDKIDEFRVLVGRAEYTTNFTPPATAYSYAPATYPGCDPTTHLLLHLEGSNNGTSFTDDGFYRRSITRNGTVVTSTDIVKFGSTSLKFGTNGGDSLSVANSVTIGTSDFTFEAWILSTDATNNTYQTFFAVGSTSSGIVARMAVIPDGDGVPSLWFEIYLNGTRYRSWTTAFGNWQWYHVIAARSGTQLMMRCGHPSYPFQQNFTITGTGSIPNAPFYVGNDSSNGGRMRGYMDEVRFTIGKALYFTSYAMPANPYSNAYNPYLTGTVGSLGISGTDIYICTAAGSPGSWKYLPLQDVTVPAGANELAQNLTGFIVGSVPITATNPFTGNTTEGAFTFNGSTSNYMAFTAAQMNTLMYTGSTQDMWVDMWFKLNATVAVPTGLGDTARPYFIGYMAPTSSTMAWAFGVTNQMKVCFMYATNGSAYITGNTTISTGTWYHIAVSYSATGNQVRIYLNGVAQTLSTSQTASMSLSGSGTTTVSANQVVTNYVNTQNIQIGEYCNTAINGYLSNIRLIVGKGAIQYTSNYSVPTLPSLPGTGGKNVLCLRALTSSVPS